MIHIAIQELNNLFLVSLRLATFLVLSPLEAVRLLPITVRLSLLFLLALFIVPTLPQQNLALDDFSIVLSCLAELCNGFLLSLSLYVAFAVFQVAGQVIDTQMGMNALAIFNPSNHSHEPLTAKLLGMIALLFFFKMDGLEKLLQILIMSFQQVRPGQCMLFTGFSVLVHSFSNIFMTALILSSPVLFSLLIVDLCTAFLSRSMPQISVYFLSLPLKIILGLLILCSLLDYINPLMEQLFQSSLNSMEGLGR